jgi:hypothetical protein
MKNLSLTFCLVIATLFGSVGGGFASDLPDCPTDQSKRFHNCFGTYTFASGGKYVGEWKDGKQHGQGIKTWMSGSKYAGEFKNGKRDGHGTYTYGSGDIYIGDFKDDKRNGKGSFTSVDGRKYVGEWKGGKTSGKGTTTFVSGNIYTGEGKDGKMLGKGTFTWTDGDKYVGEFKDNKLHGQGIYYYRNGKIKEGVWKNDNFQYAQKTPYSRKLSLLSTAFNNLPIEQRKQLQTNLKNLGLYTSSVDSLYGKGTAAALTKYNKKYLSGFDLNKSENVDKLFRSVFALTKVLK